MSDKYPLSKAMENSLSDRISDLLSNIGEITLDIIMNDELLRGIPLISAAVSLFRMGSIFRDKHNIGKIASFIQEINDRCIDEKTRQRYIEDFKNNANKREQELEYVVIICDRYINYDKARYLAILYLAYLDLKIDWVEFCKYSEVIDRFLPGDLEFLKENSVYQTEIGISSDNILRLVAQGLVIDEEKNIRIKGLTGTLDLNDFSLNGRKYKRTEFGDKLIYLLFS